MDAIKKFGEGFLALLFGLSMLAFIVSYFAFHWACVTDVNERLGGFWSFVCFALLGISDIVWVVYSAFTEFTPMVRATGLWVVGSLASLCVFCIAAYVAGNKKSG